MAEVVETNDLTEPEQHGWAVGYRIRREDGEELHAEVRCWDKARAAAEQSANADALAAIADRGVAAVLEHAEQVESPATRGAVLISIWFDPVDDGQSPPSGQLRARRSGRVGASGSRGAGAATSLADAT